MLGRDSEVFLQQTMPLAVRAFDKAIELRGYPNIAMKGDVKKGDESPGPTSPNDAKMTTDSGIRIERSGHGPKVHWNIAYKNIPTGQWSNLLNSLPVVNAEEAARRFLTGAELVSLFNIRSDKVRVLDLRHAERFAIEHKIVVQIAQWGYRLAEEHIDVLGPDGNQAGQFENPDIRYFLRVRLHSIFSAFLVEVVNQSPERLALKDKIAKQGIPYNVEFTDKTINIHLGGVNPQIDRATGNIAPAGYPQTLREQSHSMARMGWALGHMALQGKNEPLTEFSKIEFVLASQFESSRGDAKMTTESGTTSPYSPIRVPLKTHKQAVANFENKEADQATWQVVWKDAGFEIVGQEGFVSNETHEFITRDLYLLHLVNRGPPQLSVLGSQVSGLESTARSFEIVLTTDRLNLADASKKHLPFVAAAQLKTATDPARIYLHPYFFEQPLGKQIEILYHELIDHIAAHRTDDTVALAQTREFMRASSANIKARLNALTVEIEMKSGRTLAQKSGVDLAIGEDTEAAEAVLFPLIASLLDARQLAHEFVRDVLREINEEILPHMILQNNVWAMTFPAAEHWFVPVISLTLQEKVYMQRLHRLSEISGLGSTLLLGVQGFGLRFKHQTPTQIVKGSHREEITIQYLLPAVVKYLKSVEPTSPHSVLVMRVILTGLLFIPGYSFGKLYDNKDDD